MERGKAWKIGPIRLRTVLMYPLISWASLEGANLNPAKGNDYVFPIFTLGRYHEHNRHSFLSLTIQVNHAVCGGFHVCRLIGKTMPILRETS